MLRYHRSLQCGSVYSTSNLLKLCCVLYSVNPASLCFQNVRHTGGGICRNNSLHRSVFHSESAVCGGERAFDLWVLWQPQVQI